MAVNKKSGKMKSNVSMGAQTLENCKVKWSHIQKPDLEYNSGHSVSIEVTPELKKLHKEMIAQTGVKHINGLKTEDGVDLAKFGTKIYVSDNIERYPNVYDSNGEKTMDSPFGGDVINLIFKPKVWDVSGKQSISCYLQEIQIVEKINSSVTFAKPKSQEDSVTFSKDDDEDEDLPF